ncbi:MaoC/PaaZ C-terminal domain-containing protein [Nitratifractor sp.]
MTLETHKAIDESLCGRLTKLEENYAEVRLHTSAAMLADERGLIHGGFLFGAADYAAMAAVNDPYVVLGAAEVKFLAPVRHGQTVLFRAEITGAKAKKRLVLVTGECEGARVFEGSFTAFVLERHVLEH